MGHLGFAGCVLDAWAGAECERHGSRGVCVFWMPAFSLCVHACARAYVPDAWVLCECPNMQMCVCVFARVPGACVLCVCV